MLENNSNNNTRILALDYGQKRTGIAVTDPLKILASPLETVNTLKIFEFLKKYTETETIEAFVVGMPKNLDNTDTNNTPHVKGFVKALTKLFPDIPIHLEDERFTSKMALAAMIAAGTTKKQRQNKGNIDKISAVIILESFLSKIPAP